MGSGVWIPLEHRRPCAAWVDACDQTCYVNDPVQETVSRCRACGSTDIMFTEVDCSTKEMVSRFCQTHGLEDVSDELEGPRDGDVICTCLSCGAVEEGSAPFDMIEEVTS